MKVQATYNASGITIPDGTNVELQVDGGGNLKVTQPAIPGGSTYESFTTGSSDITDNSAHQVFAAPGTGKHHYITSITVTNNSTTDTVVYIKDGSTIIFSALAKAGAGFTLEPKPYLYQPTVNAVLNIQCATSGAAIQANIIGFYL